MQDGNDPFTITKYDVTHHSDAIKADFDALEGQEVSIAGRMMAKRIMGKASFCNVQDFGRQHPVLCRARYGRRRAV